MVEMAGSGTGIDISAEDTNIRSGKQRLAHGVMSFFEIAATVGYPKCYRQPRQLYNPG